MTADDAQPDPEVGAGRALRRLRLARQWSQEEAARRMRAYGYDFHQTTIAKIEAAQRPLRVRELADFAALYGVEIQELVFPPSGSLVEVNQEIAELEAKRKDIRIEISENQRLLAAARDKMFAAEEGCQMSLANAAMLDSRLAALMAEREKLVGWGADNITSPADAIDLVRESASEQAMSNDEQSSASATLTNLANLGEMYLQMMTPPALGIFQNMAIADRAAQWAQVAIFVVRIALGESQCKELSPGTPGRSSPAHPAPDDIAPDLADSWDSVAWRIDKLREWATGTVN